MQARCSKVNGETRLQSITIQRKNYWSLQNSAWGSGKSDGCLVNKHTHIIKYALCTKIKLSSFLHIFAAISYCLMPQIVVRGHPLGGSSTAHAPYRVSYWSFTNYVSKARQVGRTGNVKDMQIFPYNSKGIPSKLSTRCRQVVNNGQNLVNVVCERPLSSKSFPSF